MQDVIKNEEVLPDNIYIENKDLVFEEEKNRINSLDNTTSSNNYSKPGIILNTSSEFKTYIQTKNTEKGIYSIRFISIENKYPNSELRELMCNGIWINDSQFAYSVRQKGIYLYDSKEITYKTIVTGKDDYIIRGMLDGKLYYDDGKNIELK